jgi:hypothetical protein
VIAHRRQRLLDDALDAGDSGIIPALSDRGLRVNSMERADPMGHSVAEEVVRRANAAASPCRR